MEIGKIIKEIRLVNGVKQYELAYRCKMSGTALSLIEKGVSQPTKKTLKKIFDILEVKETYLLILSGDKETIIKL